MNRPPLQKIWFSSVTKPTLVAIYARVSTNEQNPEAQLLALREYAARRGFSVYKEYVDHVSGDVERRRAKRQKDRAYRELMEAAGRRSFDCVLVWKYDRFARSLSILVGALQQFSTLGIDFISYTQNIDTTTAMGRLFYHVIGSFAEFEREMIVERVRAGLANARAKANCSAARPNCRAADRRLARAGSQSSRYCPS
jgi:DNA invertase Pin-like site-specific DNA recombinase